MHTPMKLRAFVPRPEPTIKTETFHFLRIPIYGMPRLAYLLPLAENGTKKAYKLHPARKFHTKSGRFVSHFITTGTRYTTRHFLIFSSYFVCYRCSFPARFTKASKRPRFCRNYSAPIPLFAILHSNNVVTIAVRELFTVGNWGEGCSRRHTSSLLGNLRPSCFLAMENKRTRPARLFLPIETLPDP